MKGITLKKNGAYILHAYDTKLNSAKTGNNHNW